MVEQIPAISRTKNTEGRRTTLQQPIRFGDIFGEPTQDDSGVHNEPTQQLFSYGKVHNAASREQSSNTQAPGLKALRAQWCAELATETSLMRVLTEGNRSVWTTNASIPGNRN